jgi:energy-coupling factor transporter transmembrane protein EcfT
MIPFVFAVIPFGFAMITFVFAVIPFGFAMFPFVFAVIPFGFAVIPFVFAVIPFWFAMVPFWFAMMPSTCARRKSLRNVFPEMCSPVAILVASLGASWERLGCGLPRGLLHNKSWRFLLCCLLLDFHAEAHLWATPSKHFHIK